MSIQFAKKSFTYSQIFLGNLHPWLKFHPSTETKRHQIMTIEKTLQGAWRITDIIGGYLLVRQYFGYSKSEAVRAFVNENGRGAA